VKWSPPGYLEPITDWFHKYVVSSVIETDRTGGSDGMVTRYDYQGDAADLQLGGQDDVTNMWPLDSSVNRSLGSQISHQLRGQGLQAGDVVCSVSITVRKC
jgi:hypothetical protein